MDSSVRLHFDRGVIVLAKAAAVQVSRATSGTLIEKACYEDLALCVAHACGGSGMEEIQLKKEKITPRVLLIQDRLGVVDIVRHYERNTKGKTILAPEKQKKKKEI